MKKLLIILTLTSSTAFAQFAITPEKFAQHKALTLEALDKREQILKNEKVCVQQSTTVDNLKNCFKEARQNRHEMDKELRPKKP